jgi:hypothetical protein
MSGLDWNNALTGAYRSGQVGLGRENVLSGLERNRKEAVNTYVENQKNLFNEWYNNQMENYQNSAAPDAFTLGGYGIDLGNGNVYNVDTANRTKYTYNPAFSLTDLFKYGGYSAPTSMYNMPTALTA